MEKGVETKLISPALHNWCVIKGCTVLVPSRRLVQ